MHPPTVADLHRNPDLQLPYVVYPLINPLFKHTSDSVHYPHRLMANISATEMGRCIASAVHIMASFERKATNHERSNHMANNLWKSRTLAH